MDDRPAPDHDPHRTFSAPQPPITSSHFPAVVGERYELQGLLAVGGMGSVHIAWDKTFGRTVAIKLINENSASELALARFKHESLVSAQLQHPNIPPIYDYGTYDLPAEANSTDPTAPPTGRPCLAMKLVKGHTLADHIKEPGPDTPNLITVFEAICQAVGYAHSRNVIHRDLKPLNIMVGAFGEVQVMDWGLAKVLTDRDASTITEYDPDATANLGTRIGDPDSTDDSKTTAGTVLGTPSYMPPEQALGALSQITERSDVFGLGAILCAILTGKSVFHASTFEATRLMAARGDTADAFTRLDASGAEPELIALTKKCLAAKPEDRFANGTEVADAVRDHRANVEARLRTAEIDRAAAEAKGVEARKRRRVQTWSAIAVMTILAAGTGIAVWLAVQARDEASRADKGEKAALEASALATAEATKARAAEKLARRQSADAAINIGLRSFEDGKPLLGQLWFAEALKRYPDDEDFLRTHRERIALHDRYPQRYRPVKTVIPDGEVLSSVLSPDGRRVAYTSTDKTVRVWDIETGKPLTPLVTHNGGAFDNPVFSPDGRRIALKSDARVWQIWNVETGMTVSPPLAHQEEVGSLSFSPDGSKVVTVSGRKWSVQIWNATTGKAFDVPVATSGYPSMAFTPDSKGIAIADEKAVRIWDLESRKPVSATMEFMGRVGSLSFSHDGRLLAISTEKNIQIWAVAKGQSLTLPTENNNGYLFSIVFSPDGRRVVTVGDREMRVWDTTTGKTITPPMEHKNGIYGAEFSPDGRWVVATGADRTARIWDAESGQRIALPLEECSGIEKAMFDSKGQRVLTTTRFGVKVWERENNRSGGTVIEHREPVYSAQFSPDGRRVVTSGDSTRVWDAESGQPITPPLLLGFPDKFGYGGLLASYTTDGRRLVTVGFDKTARTWDAQSGQPLTSLIHIGGYPYYNEIGKATSPDGRRVVSFNEKTARIWSTETGQPVTPPLKHDEILQFATFSPDGSRVVTGGGDGVAMLWDARTGQPISPPLVHKGEGLYLGLFSPDGRRVLTADFANAARIWDTETGQPVTPFLGITSGVNSAAFSPDGRRVVIGSASARIWDAETGKPLTPPFENISIGHLVAFSPDGRWVAASGENNTFRIWDAATGRPISHPFEHDDGIRSISFSPNGRRIVSASDDKTARIWDVSIVPRPDEDTIKLA
ncbi:MAG: PD40 domain-containing protein, partial [Planctomycetia bacterium]|nr:PD40 domain-containing protein [Planctomycetia bacterium]